jgi:hypothetical protein
MSSLNSFIRFPLAAAMLAAMGSLGAGGCSSDGQAGEAASVVAIESVPEAARATMQAKAGESAISEVTTFEEDGKQMYMARTIQNGRTTGIEVYATGEVCCIETKLEASELPPVVKRSADAETLGYPQREFWRKDSKDVVTYVVTAASRARSKHVEIDAQGTIIKSTFTNN